MMIDGTSAIVTGGASGLGAATAERLAALGAKVAILDLGSDTLDATAERIGALPLAADVRHEDEVTAALDAAAAANGMPRIVVSCAGIASAGRVVGREGPMPLETFAKTVEVNLIGTFNVLRLAAHRMSGEPPDDDGGRGVVINTASVAATDGQIGQAAYAASKGGIVSLALPAARELARFGIRVNTIAPGIFRTPLMDNLPPEAAEALSAAIPFPARLGTPAEFAEAVVFCVWNDYLNAEVIRLDGGVRLQPK